MIDPAPDPPVELLKAAGEGLTKAEIERGARTIAEEHGVSWDRLSGQYGAMEREQYRAEACAVMVEDRAGLMAAGRLLPEPVETRHERAVEVTYNDGTPTCIDDQWDDAKWGARQVLRYADVRSARPVQRDVQVFADGRELIGTWVPVPDPQEG